MTNLLEIINLLLEQEFLTKDNIPIKFKIYEQSPRPGDNLGRGWVVHRIEALVNDKEVGFINISYIPKKNFEKEYPSIVHYLDKITGKRISPGREYEYRSSWADHLDELSLPAQIRAISSIIDPNMFSTYRENVIQPEEMTDKELFELKQQLIEKLEKRYGKQFREFGKFHVDKPLVDYIKVDEDFRRKRIGAALYEKAAKWLAKRGLKLYASGLQSNEAQSAWKWLEQNRDANIGTEIHGNRKRMFLSYL